MLKKSLSSGRKILLCTCAALSAALLLAACSPTFNWRQVQSSNAPYSVMLPAKPATYTREVDLDGVKANMTMTAAEVDDTVFAVGSAKMADTTQATAALKAMKTALLKNINGKVKAERASAQTNSQGTSTDMQIEAIGEVNGKPTLLAARLISKDQLIYQIIVIGPEKAVSRENIDMFLSSFKAN